MEVSIAIHTLLFNFQILQGYAYEIHMPVPYTVKRIGNCHKCIQRFVQHANFTYDLRDSKIPAASVSLEMFADVTDDIPFSFIQQSCIRPADACITITQNTYGSEEQRKLVHILRERIRNSDKRNDGLNKVQLSDVHIGDKESRDKSKNALKKVRLFGVDISVEGEKEADAYASDNMSKEAQSQGANLDGVVDNDERNAASQDAPNYSPSVKDNACKGAQVLSANLDGIASSDRSKHASNNLFILGADSRRKRSKRECNDDSKISRVDGASVQKKLKLSTYCLLLKVNLFELWIHACLQCLSPGGEDERYLISKPSSVSHQWALRHTSPESPHNTAQKCSASCGTIRWGSETSCLVARLYSTAQVDSAPGLAGYHYFQLNVDYLPRNKDGCLSCVRSTVTPLVEHTEGASNFFGLTNQTVSLSKFAETCVVKDAVCKTFRETKKQISAHLSNFVLLSPGEHGVGESCSTSPQKKWSTPYQCLHFMSHSRYPVDIYRYPVDLTSAKSMDESFFSPCLNCLLKDIGNDDIYTTLKSLIQSFQPTSPTSSLVFFSKAIYVQELAVQCEVSCEWVSGLSSEMCNYLVNMIATKRTRNNSAEVRVKASTSSSAESSKKTERHCNNVCQEYHISASSHVFLPSSRKGKTNVHDAIQRLSNSSPTGSVWFIQFEKGESEKGQVFRNMALCIATVSNAYVISSVSWYVLVSRLDFTHLDTVCELSNDIEVSGYESMDLGFDPHPLKFSCITHSLGFTLQSVPRDILRSRLGRTHPSIKLINKGK
uniref:AlNc14C415G11483 protein n=1 Tax=Albugo laibachii Nc14 TaxID=890382 RepID=F0WZ77_9STRA|nr:AlNc14C415G11483 [Albugo laibachii Nc14]|eukprot:CCA26793.1 AlNc14C415G11483 [Albugo laibachii Nc14]